MRESHSFIMVTFVAKIFNRGLEASLFNSKLKDLEKISLSKYD